MNLDTVGKNILQLEDEVFDESLKKEFIEDAVGKNNGNILQGIESLLV